MPVHENHTGKSAPPDEISLSDSVQSMMMDMPQDTRRNIDLSAQQAMENPEDFIRYVVIMLGDINLQLNTILGALIHEGIISIERNDDAPSA